MATELTPRAGKPGALAARPRTIGALWRGAVAENRSKPAYLVESDGGWREVGWEAVSQRVDELANGLLALGVRKGDAVAIVARTTLEWALFDFALAHVGAIGTPIYPNSSPGETAHVLAHSESIAVLVEDEAQLEKVNAARSDAPHLEHVLSFADLDELASRGRAYAREHPDALDAAVAAIDAEDAFTYLYTSGTTGPPKGCVVRHRNYYEMADCVTRVPEFLLSEDLMLLYLPLSHNFGRLMHLLGPHIGFTIAFLPDPLRVGDVMPEVRPTLLPSVPRVYEKVYAAVRGRFDAETGAKRRLIDWALGVGYRASRYRQRGRPLPRALAIQHRLADRLVYGKVKERLGGRWRLGISGGAPLAKEIGEFFGALDILILEGYGLTECTTACAVNRPGNVKFGTVGVPLPGFELRVAGDGELLIRGETVFAGYLRDEEATRAVLDDDGWLHSGDIAEIDADGFVTITDRKKDIIVTAGGKNIAPQNIENALKATPLVSQALVVGDRRPYVTALITLDPQSAAERDGDALRTEVQAIVDGVNAGLSRFEQIKKFEIVPREFTIEDDEMTPTLKLKRRVIEQHFAAEIESLYR